MDTETIIKSLSLEPHPKEGGYFRRTYESELTTEGNSGQRKLLTSIYYLLTSDCRVGVLHKNKSDIIHYYHLGDPLEYVVLHPTGKLETVILGPDITKGQHLQFTVLGGCWKGSRLLGDTYSLISEAVSPGFEYVDNELATSDLLEELPEITQKTLLPFIQAND